MSDFTQNPAENRMGHSPRGPARGSVDDLIADLVADLEPVHRPGRLGLPMTVWLCLAAVYSIAALAALAPFREGALRSLAAFPAFAAETALGALAVGILALAALLSAVPGAAKPSWIVGWSALAVGVWLGFYVAGLAGYPAHPVSDLGHREHCFLENQLIALPNAALLLWLTARLMPLRPVLTGALAGCAGAAAPAALMQLACMYSPEHILVYHVTPVLITGSACALAAPLLLRRRSVLPRKRGRTLH